MIDKQMKNEVAKGYLSILQTMKKSIDDGYKELYQSIAQLLTGKPVAPQDAVRIILESEGVMKYLNQSPNARRFQKVVSEIYNAIDTIECSMQSFERKRDALGRFTK